MKTYLEVPYQEKDKAKEMGARFDMYRKQWYVPDGVDLVPFLPWVPGVRLSNGVKSTLGKTALKLAKNPHPPKDIRDALVNWAKGKAIDRRS